MLVDAYTTPRWATNADTHATTVPMLIQTPMPILMHAAAAALIVVLLVLLRLLRPWHQLLKCC